MQEQVTHTDPKDLRSRGPMVVPVAHKKEGYEKKRIGIEPLSLGLKPLN